MKDPVKDWGYGEEAQKVNIFVLQFVLEIIYIKKNITMQLKKYTLYKYYYIYYFVRGYSLLSNFEGILINIL